MIRVIKERCNGCGKCVEACPYDAIRIKGEPDRSRLRTLLPREVVVVLENCTFCGACVNACEFNAIEITRESKDQRPETKDQYKGVWVFVELSNGKIHPVVFELLGKGRGIADKLGVELGVVVLGDRIGDHTQELVEYGVDKVYLVEDEKLMDFNVDSYTSVITKLVRKYKPEIFLAGSTSMGRTLFPRVAARLGTGLTADCTELDIDNGLLVQTRPAFGGNIMATILCKNRRPQMATVRHKVFKSEVKGKRWKVKVIKEEFPEVDFASRTRVVKFIEDMTQRVNIQSADIIVSGGMGLRLPENFKLIEELADVIGGAVGSSRPPVDRGWIPYSHQIGQTGKTVRPKVYIACGISGAIQHLAGMSSAERIIGINKDPNAPIFKIADLGIVGDLFEIVPKLIGRLNKR